MLNHYDMGYTIMIHQDHILLVTILNHSGSPKISDLEPFHSRIPFRSSGRIVDVFTDFSNDLCSEAALQSICLWHVALGNLSTRCKYPTNQWQKS